MVAKQTPNSETTQKSQPDQNTGSAVSPEEALQMENRSPTKTNRAERLVSAGMWLIALSLVILAGYLGWQKHVLNVAAAESPQLTVQLTSTPTLSPPTVDLGVFSPVVMDLGLYRQSKIHTIIPSRPRQDAIEYTVTQGDSIFAIAKKFNLKPETILWANYDQLNDQPDTLSVGMVLNIPPVDGVYYEWKEGDTLESVASVLKTTPEDILNWPANQLDLTDPNIEVGSFVMVPNGKREFRSWIVPQIARGSAGVSKSVYGAGACEGNYDGAYGTGGFIWPSANHYLSGNDFWSGHLGIDIAGGTGDPVVASDSGVIVFAGWATGGYGFMVMIDHGNGYQTVYAHLSAVGVGCGQSVYQGGYIGAIGSTGNSTGSHLHFEVRVYGQFVNPWHVLP